MNKDKFVKEYCKRSDISEETLYKFSVVLPCNCGEHACKGWAVVSNNDLSIKSHKELYMS
jgi:hypothetical protein